MNVSTGSQGGGRFRIRYGYEHYVGSGIELVVRGIQRNKGLRESLGASKDRHAEGGGASKHHSSARIPCSKLIAVATQLGGVTGVEDDCLGGRRPGV